MGNWDGMGNEEWDGDENGGEKWSWDGIKWEMRNGLDGDENGEMDGMGIRMG